MNGNYQVLIDNSEYEVLKLLRAQVIILKQMVRKLTDENEELKRQNTNLELMLNLDLDLESLD